MYCQAAGVKLGNIVHIEDLNPDSLGRGGHGESVDLTAHDEDSDIGTLQSGSLVVSAAVLVGYTLLHD